MRLTSGLLIASAFVVLTHSVAAANDASFSTFIYPTDKGNLTFALSATSIGDVYIHLSAPATYQWVGVGTGSEMDGSVMWIVHESSDKNGITLSPRLSDGHVEPSFSDRVNCSLVDGAGYHNSINQTVNTRYYSANIHCANISALGHGDGKLDLSNAKQPFIYAWGPTDGAISSASKTAGIKRHDSYGTFWMDMKKATTSGADEASVPTGSALLTTTNAGADGNAESDGDKVGPAHAAIMLATFAIIFPLGAILLRFLESVKIHGIVQAIGVFAAIVGVGLGIYLSKMYNHSKDVSSGHQVFGLVLLVLLLFQWAIGFYHHLRFRKYKKPTIYGRIHLFAGPAIVLGGIINGFTGFNFSGEPHNNLYYGIAVAIILIIVLAMLGWKRWSKSKQHKGTRMTNNEFEDESYGLNLVPGSHNVR